MKRFWKNVTSAPVDGGWQVMLDARAVKTQAGQPQIAPTPALADLLAEEWRAQGEDIDPKGFVYRDMADYAIDMVATGAEDLATKLLAYAESDTLCYRADPDEPLYQRQRALWEPIVTACEARHGVTFQRVSGIIHRPQKAETLASLRRVLEAQNPFVLAGLFTLSSISASLITALAALEADADAAHLFTAANAEEEWQAELWGWDWEAEDRRALRLDAFSRAMAFVRAAQG
jgi:chaperone required for assembly of F1-ATPase